MPMKGRAGFSLIEALIATTIFTVGILALAQAFSAGSIAFQDVGNIDIALNIAQSRMEQLRNTAFNSLTNSQAVDPRFPQMTVTVAVTPNPPGQIADPKDITVTVEWEVKGGRENISLRTRRTA